MSPCWSFVLNEGDHLKKVADDIAASSLFSPGCQTESSIPASFPLPVAKDFCQTGLSMQMLQKLFFSTNPSTALENLTVISTRPEMNFCFRGNQASATNFSLSRWFYQPCQTTGLFIYCASEAENRKFFRHKNYPNHVSNNCLVLTYK